MKFIVEILKTVAVILITAVVMLIVSIGVIMVFISISRAVRVKADTCKSSLIFNEDTCKFPRGQLYS